MKFEITYMPLLQQGHSLQGGCGLKLTARRSTGTSCEVTPCKGGAG